MKSMEQVVVKIPENINKTPKPVPAGCAGDIRYYCIRLSLSAFVRLRGNHVFP